MLEKIVQEYNEPKPQIQESEAEVIGKLEAITVQNQDLLERISTLENRVQEINKPKPQEDTNQKAVAKLTKDFKLIQKDVDCNRVRDGQ